MGRIIFGMMQSLDGYIAGPDGEPGLPIPDDELHRHFNGLMRRTAVALYGRRMYEVMRYWETAEQRPGATEIAVDFADAWRNAPKVVFSTTLKTVGPNATLVRHDVEEHVRAIKAETEGDIMVSGATLAASLGRLGLIDEYQLYFHPVVLGGGKPFFETGLSLQLRPLGTEQLPQGVTLLRYAPAA